MKDDLRFVPPPIVKMLLMLVMALILVYFSGQALAAEAK